MTLKRVIQAILLIWFVSINAAILIPSYQLLLTSADIANIGLSQPPAPPPLLSTIGPLDPNLDATKQAQRLEDYKQQIAVYAEQIKGYTQEVTAYTQQVAAYKTYTDANEKSGRRGVYELVVRNSLITLVGSFATTLIAYVFTNLGAGVVDNMIRMKNNRDPQPLKLL
ncbi:MAG: hypothetical protein WBV94_29120 [Blastocatellia bacterium]